VVGDALVPGADVVFVVARNFDELAAKLAVTHGRPTVETNVG
jgi:hypothetical protein